MFICRVKPDSLDAGDDDTRLLRADGKIMEAVELGLCMADTARGVSGEMLLLFRFLDLTTAGSGKDFCLLITAPRNSCVLI